MLRVVLTLRAWSCLKATAINVNVVLTSHAWRPVPLMSRVVLTLHACSCLKAAAINVKSCLDIAGLKLLEGRCHYYGNREKVKDLLQLCQLKALVTSHEPEDWQSYLSITSQVWPFTYLLWVMCLLFVSWVTCSVLTVWHWILTSPTPYSLPPVNEPNHYLIKFQ